MADRIVDRIKVLTSPEMATHMESLTARIVKSRDFRAALAKNPQAALQGLGIPVDKGYKLSKRDTDLLDLISDEEIPTLFREGNLAKLREIVLERYPGIKLPDKGDPASVEADFDVLIEAEAVAVAVVAVAAIAVGAAVIEAAERFRIAEEIAAVHNARITALEARVRLLESR